MLERRNFLTALSATMVTAMLPAGVIAAVPKRSGQSDLLRDQFAALIGNDFRLVDEAGIARKARLVALDDGHRCPGLEQFSIVFEGSNLADGLHELYRPHAGRMTISLMPSGISRSETNRKRVYFSNFV